MLILLTYRDWNGIANIFSRQCIAFGTFATVFYGQSELYIWYQVLNKMHRSENIIRLVIDFDRVFLPCQLQSSLHLSPGFCKKSYTILYRRLGSTLSTNQKRYSEDWIFAGMHFCCSEVLPESLINIVACFVLKILEGICRQGIQKVANKLFPNFVIHRPALSTCWFNDWIALVLCFWW